MAGSMARPNSHNMSIFPAMCMNPDTECANAEVISRHGWLCHDQVVRMTSRLNPGTTSWHSHTTTQMAMMV